MLISLIGMPGGGKTTAGRLLAARLGRPFVDSDARIEERLGTSIRQFFEREGEDRFRDIEQQVIGELTAGFDGVLATGGGVVLREANRVALRARSTVVYLTSTPQALWRRLRFDAKRPLLAVDDPFARLRSMHDIRDPLYRATAHFSVSVGHRAVSALVTTILTQLELAGIVNPYDVPSIVDPLRSSGPNDPAQTP